MTITSTGNISEGPIGMAGDVVGTGLGPLLTRINGESAVFPMGCMIVEGATEGQGVLPVDANSKPVGISRLNQSYEADELDANGWYGYPVSQPMAAVTGGLIYVRLGSDVSKGDPAFWVHTTNGASIKGTFRNDADTSNAVQLASATFEIGGLAGGVGLLLVK